jgi:hypothetical protein
VAKAVSADYQDVGADWCESIHKVSYKPSWSRLLRVTAIAAVASAIIPAILGFAFAVSVDLWGGPGARRTRVPGFGEIDLAEAIAASLCCAFPFALLGGLIALVATHERAWDRVLAKGRPTHYLTWDEREGKR